MKLGRLLFLLTLPLLLSTVVSAQTESWTPTARPPREVGGEREGHKAVWTGTEMIMWGGVFGSNGINKGGVYDPATNTWRPVSRENAPTPYLGGNTTIWAGDGVNKMIVYGGSFYPQGRDGGMYDPVTDQWTKIEISGDKSKGIPVPPNVPKDRSSHSAVWTGKEMIVWGGHCIAGCYRTDGAAYNPLTDTWRPIRTPAFLDGRQNHTAIWTGKVMIIWGGTRGTKLLRDGGLYDPETDEWTPITLEGAPAARIDYTTVWTGREMILWGGKYHRASGTIYDPALNRWRPMSTQGLPLNSKKQPLGREMHTAVWTGEEMIIWGGIASSGDDYRGARYNPEADQWFRITKTNAPNPRRYHTMVWGNGAMIVWGGWGSGGAYNYSGPTGGVYRPGCAIYITEPKAGDRVNREVTFRLKMTALPAPPQRLELFVDGKLHGEPQPVPPDSVVKFKLSDELAGKHVLQIRGYYGLEYGCMSSEVPVVVGPTIKVLRVIHDPKFDALQGRSLREIAKAYYVPNWNEPAKIWEEFNAGLLVASSGFARYEVTETITYPRLLRDTCGFLNTDDQLINMMANCGDRGDGGYVPGWQNFEGVPQNFIKWVDGGIGGAPPATPLASCSESQTIPNGQTPFGDKDETMLYAQSFKPWGNFLQKVQIGLIRSGSPTKRIKVSVRESLDGEDLLVAYVRPEQVTSDRLKDPTRVHVALERASTGGGDTHPCAEGRLKLNTDVLHYLVVTLAPEETAGQSTPAQPDPDNHYWISYTWTDTGVPRFTDEESKLYQGSTVRDTEDMSAKLIYFLDIDMNRLSTEVNFNVEGKNQAIAAHVREGVIDEVHFIGSPPYHTYESMMLGPDSFRMNAPPARGVQSGRAFVMMGLNYELGAAFMLHSYGHRTEDTMKHIYGGWSNDPYSVAWSPPPQLNTNWERFSAFYEMSRSISGGGTVHWPPNAVQGYDYANMRKVNSTADDWLKYPNLKRTTTWINANAWKGPDFHRNYLIWWYTRLPKAVGRNADGKLNNWWRYIVEPDYYKLRQ